MSQTSIKALFSALLPAINRSIMSQGARACPIEIHKDQQFE